MNPIEENQRIREMHEAATEVSYAIDVAKRHCLIAWNAVEAANRKYIALVKAHNVRTGANMEARWIDEPVFPNPPFFTKDFRAGEKGKDE